MASAAGQKFASRPGTIAEVVGLAAAAGDGGDLVRDVIDSPQTSVREIGDVQIAVCIDDRGQWIGEACGRGRAIIAGKRFAVRACRQRW